MRIKLTVCYDGTLYCGWQRQKNGFTVQEALEQAVETLTGEKVAVTGSGRTDSGVHAKGQVAHFDTNSTIPAEKFYLALNPLLPDDIKVLKSERVSENFHSVRSAKRKTYVYSLYLSSVPVPLYERYALRIDEPIDIKKMQKAAELFIGEKDFKAFSSTGSSVKGTVRKIYALSVEKKGEFIFIKVTGNGFLYNMVRIIAGTLVAIGKGEISEENVEKAFLTGERTYAGKTLAAKGLTLLRAEYEAE